MTAKDYAKYPNHLATKAGEEWSSVDDARVIARDIPDADLAIAIGRTVQAIHMRRHVLDAADASKAAKARADAERDTAEDIVRRLNPAMAEVLYG